MCFNMEWHLADFSWRQWLVGVLFVCLFGGLFFLGVRHVGQIPIPSPPTISESQVRQVVEEKAKREQSVTLDTLKTTVEMTARPSPPPDTPPPPMNRETQLQALDALHAKSETMKPVNTPPPSREAQSQSLDALRAKSH